MQRRNGSGALLRGVMHTFIFLCCGTEVLTFTAKKKQEKSKVETTAPLENSPASRAAPLPPGDDGAGMDVDRSADGEGKDTKETKDTHAPAKKYKMTEAMKGLIWNLVCLSNECCRIENEKKYVCKQFIWYYSTDRTYIFLRPAIVIVQLAGRFGITSKRTGSAQGAISEDSGGVSGGVDVFGPDFT